ncbi:hypothetical protein WJX77_004853 [Trebouxia sp. C0004]
MAVAKSLRQLTPTLMTHLLSTSVHGSHLCGLQQQLPCTLVSLTHLNVVSQSQQCSSQAWRYCRQQFSHQGGRAGQRQLGDRFGSHMHTPWYQHRGFATDTEEADKMKYPVRTPDSVFVYSGPLALTVSRLKKLSLFSCACTFLASPIIIYMSSASSFGAKASIAFTLCGFGLFTTGLMHWFTSPYVHRLIHNSKTGLTEVETLSILAKYKRRTFSHSEIEYPNSFRPQSTFQVHGQVYYLDADSFEDKELLAMLSPKDQTQEVKPPIDE